MFARLVRNPLLIGLGAGAVLILGSASAVVAQVDPSPSASSSATDPPPSALAVTLKRTGDNTTGDVSPGTTVPMVAEVTAGQNDLTGVKVSFSADTPATVTPDANENCDASTQVCTVDPKVGEPEPIPLTVDIKAASGTVNVRAEASADTDTLNASTSFPLTVKDPDPSSDNGGGDTGGNTGGDTGGDKDSGGSKPNGGDSHSGGSTHHSTGGSTGNVPAPGTLSPPSTSGLVPSTAPSPGAVLPSIGAQSPSTAGTPPTLNAGNSQSMRNKAEGPDELTFNKLASTQAAWLAALLVAFSLLLTQVRLGKTANRANRPVGIHRRVRRRVRPPRSH